MNDEEREQAYEDGRRMAWLVILQQCCIHLGYDDQAAQAVAWISERELAISTLREICEVHGDNDWSEDLNLSDIIERHLGRYLADEVIES